MADELAEHVPDLRRAIAPLGGGAVGVAALLTGRVAPAGARVTTVVDEVTEVLRR